MLEARDFYSLLYGTHHTRYTRAGPMLGQNMREQMEGVWLLETGNVVAQQLGSSLVRSGVGGESTKTLKSILGLTTRYSSWFFFFLGGGTRRRRRRRVVGWWVVGILPTYLPTYLPTTCTPGPNLAFTYKTNSLWPGCLFACLAPTGLGWVELGWAELGWVYLAGWMRWDERGSLDSLAQSVSQSVSHGK
ncbi:hypothetical protein B0T19DRAFT_125788 [Cercophora scortea]|uniref:Uncharacterized protein n=1 Tax=Cercophora scortea TaxID=314031 RepID=A0AAE0IY41_9PEZI|nr:hypothetical protein B0T19DRAFT_125788 [Cercophora scortea]